MSKSSLPPALIPLLLWGVLFGQEASDLAEGVRSRDTGREGEASVLTRPDARTNDDPEYTGSERTYH